MRKDRPARIVSRKAKHSLLRARMGQLPHGATQSSGSIFGGHGKGIERIRKVVVDTVLLVCNVLADSFEVEFLAGTALEL